MIHTEDMDILAKLPRRKFLLTSGVGLITFALLVYGPAVRFGFAFIDDPLLVTQNPTVWGFGMRNLLRAFTTYDPELYIPLTFLTFQFDWMLGGGDPFWFHLENILWHAASAMLVLLIFERLLQDRFIAIVVAMLFLLHPMQVEAVAWVSGRKDLVSGFFALASLLAYVHFLAARNGRTGGINTWYFLSIVAFLLALLAKVSVLLLPIVFLLMEDVRGRKLTRRSLFPILPFLGLSIVFGIVALFGKSGGMAIPIADRLLLAAKSVVFTFGKLLVPAHLSVFYPWMDPIRITDPAFALPIILMTIALVSVIILRKWSKLPFFALGWYFCFLAPSLTNLSKNGYHFLAVDRYAYLAGIGVFLLTAVLFEWLMEKICTVIPALRSREHVLPAAGYSRLLGTLQGSVLVAIVLLAFPARAQLHHWRDAESLALRTIDRSPEVSLGWIGLGNALLGKGDLRGALEAFDHAARLRPEDPEVHYGRALAFEGEERTADALDAYDRALALRPEYALALINRGKLLYRTGRQTEALASFVRARDAAPHLAMPSFNLGVLAGEAGDLRKAAALYREALEKDPRMIDALVNLAATLHALGEREEAMAMYARAREIAPNDPNVAALGRVIGQ